MSRTEPYQTDVTGFLFGWKPLTQQPMLVDIDGEPWLPLFPTEEALRACFASIGRTVKHIKQVEEGEDFLRSLAEAHVNVCIDLRHEDGRTRFGAIASDPETIARYAKDPRRR